MDRASPASAAHPFGNARFRRKPHYSLAVRVAIIVGATLFLGSWAMGMVRVIPMDPQTGLILVAIMASVFLALVLMGTRSARCTDCRGPVQWFRKRLDRAAMLQVKIAAQRDGVAITLPYDVAGQPCQQFDLGAFRCASCDIIYLNVVTDPNAAHG